MYKIIRFFFFKVDPEKVHHFTMWMMHIVLKTPIVNRIWKSSFTLESKKLERTVFGITFPNPVGLAAGFDKNATYYKDLQYCGFGFIEIGTVTPVCQEGNPKKRLFRLPEDNALINRMGFNNDGAKAAAIELKSRNSQLIIGGNIGKNKVTPNENAVSDYVISFNDLYDVVDYFVVNVSSPNTPNLRELQDKDSLRKIFVALFEERNQRAVSKPILLKIAPDLSDGQLDDIVDLMQELNIDGLIATNTTISREGLVSSKEVVQEIGAGGLSGKPLRERATEVIRYIADKSKGSFPIIGVGGIMTAEDAIEKLEAGASLVQLYTGFIYEGPAIVKRINKEILKRYN